MSCEKCERVIRNGGPVCYVRIDRANVAILGCAEHVGKVIEMLRRADDEDE